MSHLNRGRPRKKAALIDGTMIGAKGTQLTPQVCKYTTNPRPRRAPERTGSGQFPFQVPQKHPTHHKIDRDNPRFPRKEKFKFRGTSLALNNPLSTRFRYKVPECKVMNPYSDQYNSRIAPHIALQNRRKQEFLDESNRNRGMTEKQMSHIHTSAFNSTRTYFKKKYGSKEARKMRMTSAAENMFHTNRRPMTHPELMESRVRRAKEEGKRYEPKGSREQCASRQLSRNYFSNTYSRVMGTNPEVTRVIPKETFKSDLA